VDGVLLPLSGLEIALRELSKQRKKKLHAFGKQRRRNNASTKFAAILEGSMPRL
jgi:hypothetical protein